MEESKEYLEVKRMIDEAKAAGPKYWHSRTPQERLWALQRVLEIVQLRKEAK